MGAFLHGLMSFNLADPALRVWIAACVMSIGLLPDNLSALWARRPTVIWPDARDKPASKSRDRDD
jgi:hypothetical protein